MEDPNQPTTPTDPLQPNTTNPNIMPPTVLQEIPTQNVPTGLSSTTSDQPISQVKTGMDKNKLTLIIIGVVLVVVLAGVGIAAAITMNKPKASKTTSSSSSSGSSSTSGTSSSSSGSSSSSDYARMTIIGVTDIAQNGNTLEVNYTDGYDKDLNPIKKVGRTTSETKYYRRYDINLDDIDASKLYDGEMSISEALTFYQAQLKDSIGNYKGATALVYMTADIKSDGTITKMAGH